jgi:hypothetical protein
MEPLTGLARATLATCSPGEDGRLGLLGIAVWQSRQDSSLSGTATPRARCTGALLCAQTGP